MEAFKYFLYGVGVLIILGFVYKLLQQAFRADATNGDRQNHDSDA